MEEQEAGVEGRSDKSHINEEEKIRDYKLKKVMRRMKRRKRRPKEAENAVRL